MLLDKVKATIKTGEERLTYNERTLDFSLLDFWRWSVSDILSNATRGRFAEFIVATALNIDMTIIRNEWSSYDLETNEEIKLEIKSAAYIQSWYQKALSKISFSTKETLHWDSLTNKPGTEKKRHADVYVFCLLCHDNQQTIEPLNMNHWEFYVLATKELNDFKKNQKSITLQSLKKFTPVVSYSNLHKAIKDKHKLNSV
jgi:hypothetical protein